ncbi:MAG: 3-oxoacyl-[acyl-carrier-protein] reductase [Spirochaetes bacterium]|nr:MAG: 3-oxoacyl-[acyl-carrier-protein] reductase [Spirochaetota bacterium]
MSLKGKTAIVTGGSRGIGEAIVKKFIEAGANVFSLSRSEGTLYGEFSSEADGKGAFFKWIKSDLSNPADIEAAVKQILEEASSVDILVNNAGITKDGLIFRMKDEEWDDVLNTNLKSAFLLCRGFARTMIKQKSGSIINISSVVGIMGNAGQTNYSASKAGLIGLTKSLAKEVASRGVRVNAVAPGFVDTSMTEKLGEKAKEALAEVIPVKRTGKPEEIAEAVFFLASNSSTYITGQVLAVDGGMTM